MTESTPLYCWKCAKLGTDGRYFTERGNPMRTCEACEAANTWTIAWRTKGMRKFRRVTDWTGSWDQASDMAGRVYRTLVSRRNAGSPPSQWPLHSDVEVYYVSSREAEDAGWVCAEDVANILIAHSRKGRDYRAPIIERGSINDLI